jgi:methylphosphotriester-DNA--protein-cysteine methyltransferase
MFSHADIDIGIFKLIRSGEISLAGNKKLKIYGTLDCSSGKRMKKQNRVFFANEHEALQQGYRPCGKCLNEKFLEWKRKRPAIFRRA